MGFPILQTLSNSLGTWGTFIDDMITSKITHSPVICLCLQSCGPRFETWTNFFQNFIDTEPISSLQHEIDSELWINEIFLKKCNCLWLRLLWGKPFCNIVTWRRRWLTLKLSSVQLASYNINLAFTFLVRENYYSFFLKMGHSRPLFSLFSSFQHTVDSKQMFNI